MKTRILAAVLFLCLPLAALGQQAKAPSASHIQAAEELFATMKMEELMSQAIDSMLEAQMAQNPEMRKVEDVLRDFLNKYSSWKALKEPLTAIYVETFTEAELREINAFYRTPTGQKAVTVMPALFQKAAAMGQELAQEHIGELQEAAKKKLAEDGEKKP